MAQGFDARCKFYEDTETGAPADFAPHDIAHHVRAEEGFPGIRLELLDSKRKPPVRRIDVENHGLHELAFLQGLRRVLDAFRPGKIGNMYQPIDPFFNLDERTEIRQLANAAFNHGADTVAFRDRSPGIGLQLLDAQRNAAVPRLHFEHHGLHLVADPNHFARVLHPPAPRHFRDVNETLHAGLQLYERSVVCDAHDTADYTPAKRIIRSDILPRIGH